jgi:predicted nucleic acid-binding protein
VILYLDASALVKRYLGEECSELVHAFSRPSTSHSSARSASALRTAKPSQSLLK